MACGGKPSFEGQARQPREEGRVEGARSSSAPRSGRAPLAARHAAAGGTGGNAAPSGLAGRPRRRRRRRRWARARCRGHAVAAVDAAGGGGRLMLQRPMVKEMVLRFCTAGGGWVLVWLVTSKEYDGLGRLLKVDSEAAMARLTERHQNRWVNLPREGRQM